MASEEQWGGGKGAAPAWLSLSWTFRGAAGLGPVEDLLMESSWRQGRTA